MGNCFTAVIHRVEGLKLTFMISIVWELEFLCYESRIWVLVICCVVSSIAVQDFAFPISFVLSEIENLNVGSVRPSDHQSSHCSTQKLEVALHVHSAMCSFESSDILC